MAALRGKYSPNAVVFPFRVTNRGISLPVGEDRKAKVANKTTAKTNARADHDYPSLQAGQSEPRTLLVSGEKATHNYLKADDAALRRFSPRQK